MKTLATFLLSLATALPLAHAADTFEGTIAMKMTAGNAAPQSMTYSLKGGLARIDMEAAQGMGIIIDPVKMEMTMLMTQQNMHMVQPMQQAAAAARQGQPTQTTVEKTNVTEKILGYNTTKYIIKSGNDTTEAWLADDLGASFMGMGAGGRGGMMGRGRGGPPAGAAGQEWADLIKDKGGFPMRVISKGTDGRETYKLEVTAIDKKSLAASMFAPPAGSQDMSAMMQGAMQQGLRGMIPGGRGGF